MTSNFMSYKNIMTDAWSPELLPPGKPRILKLEMSCNV